MIRKLHFNNLRQETNLSGYQMSINTDHDYQDGKMLRGVHTTIRESIECYTIAE